MDASEYRESVEARLVARGDGVEGHETLDDVQWRTEGEGVQLPPPTKFRSFDKVEPDCKLSGQCLVLLFQHPN